MWARSSFYDVKITTKKKCANLLLLLHMQRLNIFRLLVIRVRCTAMRKDVTALPHTETRCRIDCTYTISYGNLFSCDYLFGKLRVLALQVCAICGQCRGHANSDYRVAKLNVRFCELDCTVEVQRCKNITTDKRKGRMEHHFLGGKRTGTGFPGVEERCMQGSNMRDRRARLPCKNASPIPRIPVAA